jgi:hypothetical protein
MEKSIVMLTGATSGIGQELAYILAEEKYDLVLVARNQNRLEVLQREIHEKYGIICRGLQADLTNEQDIKRIIEMKQAIDVLVNCAGVGAFYDIEDEADEKEQEMIQVNAWAPYKLTKCYTQFFLKRGSGIVLNVCSTSAFYPHPYMAVYGATKSFLFHYSLALSEEVKRTGKNVHILTAVPGPTRTNFIPKEQRERMLRSSLAESFEASPRDLANQLYKQLKKRKRLIVFGRGNKWMTRILMWMPFSLKLALVGKISKRGANK